MIRAVELYLDEKAEGVVRAVWARIEATGVATPTATGARPSVVLALVEEANPPELRERLESWAAQTPAFDLLLSGCATYPGVVLFAPRPSADLSEAHARLQLALRGTPGLLPELASGRWIPQCVLGSGLDDAGIAEATAVARTVSLPIRARVVEAAWVERDPLRVLVPLPLPTRNR